MKQEGRCGRKRGANRGCLQMRMRHAQMLNAAEFLQTSCEPKLVRIHRNTARTKGTNPTPVLPTMGATTGRGGSHRRSDQGR